MEEQEIEIPLDEFLLTLEPVAELSSHNSPFWLLRGRLVFPSGDVLATGLRYDSGRRWIIDPLVQKIRPTR